MEARHGVLGRETASGSIFRIAPPLQTAASVAIFMTVVLPQAGQRQRNANGDAATTQSQGVSGCFIDTLFGVGMRVELNQDYVLVREPLSITLRQSFGC
jgi:hypothetical protein